MNDEISYLFFSVFISNDEKFQNLSENELQELDNLANLMLNLDKNFYKLKIYLIIIKNIEL